MTAGAPAAVLAGWQRLNWVIWRQHRTGLVVVLGLFAATAAFMAVTGLDPAWHAEVIGVTGPEVGLSPLLYPLTFCDLLLLPAIAGLVLGAPLLAHEAESGLVRFSWTQGIGKVTLLIAKVTSIAAGLSVAAAGLSLEFAWWAGPVLKNLNSGWLGLQFTFRPLPYVGWTVFAFCLGVGLGAAFRRTVPAVVSALVSYATVFYLDNWYWRRYYLPPLRSTVPWSSFVEFGFTPDHIGRYIIASGVSRGDGQPVSHADLGRSAGWFTAHHVVQWMTYQPPSRYVLFQFLEFGYLVVLSAVLVTAAVALVRRQSA